MQTTPTPSGAKHRGKSKSSKDASATDSRAAEANPLGPLKELPGYWEGTGFSLIARPDFSEGNPQRFFLQLNMVRESMEFTSLGGPVPNRGSVQGDIELYGVSYLQRVVDLTTGGALHVEPGLFLYIPATTDPASDASVARLATIPHGNSLCAVGPIEDVVPDGLPTIPPCNTVPFTVGGNPPPAGSPNPFAAYDLSRKEKFRSSPLHRDITQAVINDPNTLLRNALKKQHLTHITRLITLSSGGGVSNIPFIQRNADSQVVESVFAIETVQRRTGETFLQLQYSQTILLNFGGLSWPHVTVATLVKAF